MRRITIRRYVYSLLIVAFYAQIGWGQAVLDDVRQDILRESKEEIKSIRKEIDRQKEIYEEDRKKKKEEKKKAYQEKIERAQKLDAIKKQQEIIDESTELLNEIEKQTKFKSKKRWRYEELLKIYAEKPIGELPIAEQEKTVNEMLAKATAELVELLKRKAIEDAKMEQGMAYEDLSAANEELLIQLNQFTKLVKKIDASKVAQQDKIVKIKETVIQSTQELIEALKKEAIRRAKIKTEEKRIAEKKMQFKDFEGTVGFHYGYDNNINADTAFEGGQFVRNYFALSWLPSLNEYIKGNLGTFYLADNHLEDQDVTFKIAAGQASIKWHPFGNDSLTIEPGFEFVDTHYPDNESVSTKENKLSLNTKHKFWNKWSQELNFEELRTTNNNNRLSRDGDGNDLPDNPLKKRKYSMEYILGFPFLYKTSFKLKQKGQRQTSSDAFTDFYDYYSYAVTSELGRSLNEKIYAKTSLSYEQKDYSTRTVSAHQLAQEDRTYTQKVTLFYFLENDWLINYTWARTKVDSNDPIYDYEKMSHLVGVYYSF